MGAKSQVGVEKAAVNAVKGVFSKMDTWLNRTKEV